MYDSSFVRFYLVRHGQVAANRNYQYVGRLDQPLTEYGEQQAASLGQALAPLEIDQVFASPLARTMATATAIAKACGLEAIPEEGLIEQSFGDWEGLTRDEVKALGGDHLQALKRFDSDASCAPPGGEALAELQKRAAAVIERRLAERSAGSVVLVSHVGPIKALLAQALGLSLQQVRPFFLDPGTITVVDWGERAWMRLFNAHVHLGWAHAKWMSR
jgi:probable phosphoglycerate mutase